METPNPRDTPSPPMREPPMPPEPAGEPGDPVEDPTEIREPEEVEEDPDGNVINPPIEDPETETEDGIGRDRQRPDRGIED